MTYMQEAVMSSSNLSFTGLHIVRGSPNLRLRIARASESAKQASQLLLSISQEVRQGGAKQK